MSSETASHPSQSLDTPSVDADAVRRLLRAELSFKSRLAYVLLLLLATGVVVAVGSLLATEPDLPAPTRGALAAICAVGSGWAVLCVRTLRRRRVLYARHRVVAARLAVAASTLFVGGSLIVGFNQSRGGFVAAACGTVWLVVAVALLLRARRRHDALLRLRQDLNDHPDTTELAA